MSRFVTDAPKTRRSTIVFGVIFIALFGRAKVLQLERRAGSLPKPFAIIDGIDVDAWRVVRRGGEKVERKTVGFHNLSRQ